MKSRQFHYVVAAIACLASSAGAQQASTPNSPDVEIARDTTIRAPHAAQQSTIDRPSDAVRRSAVVAAAPLPAATQSIGTSKAQMVVGGAAIVVGALIGGNGGSALALGGAVVGLYGLWNYLK